MMAGNPSWWSMALPQQHHHQQQQLSPNSLLSSLLGSSSPANSSSNSLTFTSLSDNNNNYNSSLENLPHNQHHSWSQLVLGGLAGNEEEDTYRGSQSHEYESKKLENWENQQIMNIGSCNSRIDHVKQESNNSNLYVDQEFHRSQAAASSWSQSCVTSNGNSVMDFSYNNKPPDFARVHQVQSPESNSTATETGGACKKPRVSSSQPPLKVRKEKLGDRITALHQLVSPFGKTDTASVLLEAIGYIRFLQSQIEALSSPYLGASASLSSSNIRNHQSVQGERNCVFPEEPGQLLNDICIKAKGAANMQEMQDRPKDLRSRGLCLVPVSCTQHVGSDNGADYWAPAMSGGF